MLEEEDGIEVVGDSQPGEEALVKVERLRPDLVLTSLRWANGEPAVFCRQIREQSPFTRVLVVSLQNREEDVLIAILARASGYVSQNAEGPELVRAIRMVINGEGYFDWETVDRVIGRIRDALAPGQNESIPDVLTDREVTVLRMVGEGLKNPEIGRGLNIATTTVRNHIINIRGKLDVSSRPRLVSYAARRGILMTEDHAPI